MIEIHDTAEEIDIPEPDGGLCPECRVGPFLMLDFYARHWLREHAGEDIDDGPSGNWDGLLGRPYRGLLSLGGKRPWRS